MKNKILASLTVLCAALVLAGGGIPGIAPMPADYEEQEDNADEE